VNARRTSRQQPPDTRPLEPRAGIWPSRARPRPIGERLALGAGHRDARAAVERHDRAGRAFRWPIPGSQPWVPPNDDARRRLPSPRRANRRRALSRRRSPHHSSLRPQPRSPVVTFTGSLGRAQGPTIGCCGCNPRHRPLYVRLQPDTVLPQSLGHPRNAELDFEVVPGPETNRRVTISQ
jgi:hypothetical protein